MPAIWDGEQWWDQVEGEVDIYIPRLQDEVRERVNWFVELEREFQTRIGVRVLDAELDDRFGPVEL
jgi:hypothetical protein